MRFLSLTKRKSLKLAATLLLAAFTMPALAQDAPALKIAVIGLVLYFIIRIVSPDTARSLRSKWTGP